MVMLELFSKSVKTKYRNHFFSKATFFVLTANIIAISFPFIFAYRSKDFWLKHDIFFEQPDIRYKGEYLFIGYTDNTSNPILCNNFPHYQLHNNYDTCSTIKAREIDNNLDGKIDELYFNLNINIPENAHLMSMDLLLTIDYKLHAPCPLNMQSAIILQEVLNSFISQLQITSNLQVSQKYPLFCYSKGQDIIYNESVIPNAQNYESYKIQNIINNYYLRNISTHLSMIYKSFGTEDQSSFELQLKIFYPEHQIYYRPGFWQVIKWAWIQYFSVYIVFAWFIKQFKTYIFDNKLVLFHELSPLKKQK